MKYLTLTFSAHGSQFHQHLRSQAKEWTGTILLTSDRCVDSAEGSLESNALQLSKAKFKEGLDLGTSPSEMLSWVDACYFLHVCIPPKSTC